MTELQTEVKADNRGSEVSPDLLIEFQQVKDPELHLGLSVKTITEVLGTDSW